MKLSDFNYDLPEHLIAKRPPVVRGQARLLVLNKKTGQLEDTQYQNIINYLHPGDVLILNDTRVIKARLFARKKNGAQRELIILEKHSDDTDWHKHTVLYRRRINPGDMLTIGDADITVEKVLGNGLAVVKSTQNLLEIASSFGEVPLPPYMHRKASPLDTKRYQTVWARENGSVAAPTASLNMTTKLLDELKAKGIHIEYLTLHVGLGTFMPIRTDTIEDHHMHEEYFRIPARTIAAIQSARAEKKRIVALGTTVTRSLEFAHDALHQTPQDIYGEANIFIYPGYKFKAIDGLITNFHAPKSTVLMLTAAFADWNLLRKAYEHAVAEQYRFLSYGDSMLIK